MCTVLDAELWGILDGLNLILERGYGSVLIQTDSLEAVNVIQEESFRGSTSALVRRIRQLLDTVRLWKIQHISRDKNKIADGLVRMVHDRRSGLRVFEDSLL
ncbi:hypothetical protein Godav_029679 [Gossypium davidsonii]|uniref:RNase H type-1 domain-containing protein n=2 Tax=Gossypium TaxID=3633 RepID=A0A7J8TIM9_GOSDV|nr:hypothetical protein [Gossypium davidsonii]MBA0672399.1 hypothetical protein [Gossypium klotzschianum]